MDTNVVDRICDAHHHLWREPPTLAWPSRYLIDDLVGNCLQTGIPMSTIFVECGIEYRTEGPEWLRPVGETEFVESSLSYWRETGGTGSIEPCAAIVGFADLRRGVAVREVIDAHLAASPTRFKGIRYQAACDPDPGVRSAATDPPPQLLGSPAFREGLREVVASHLVFNVWVYHPQLAEVAALADALPDLTIILEHCGGPLGLGSYAGRSEAVFAQWRPLIAELAHRQNVYVKLGALTMDLTGLAGTVSRSDPGVAEAAVLFEPWFHYLVEQFGVDRCMLECNYPFESLGLRYVDLWDAYSIIFSSYSRDERAALFSRTAERTYGVR